MKAAIQLSDSLIQRCGKGYVCVTGVHGVMEAQTDSSLRHILNRSFLTTPDGMPMVWIGRMQRKSRISRVYGRNYMDGCVPLFACARVSTFPLWRK